MDNFFTVQEIADKLQLNRETILIRIRNKDIEAYKLGREWRIKEEDLMKYIEEQSNMKGD